MNNSHLAPIKSKIKVVNKLQDPTFKRLATRIILRNYPEQASPQQQYAFNNYLVQSQQYKIPRDYKGDFKLTKNKALSEIDKLLNELIINQEQRDVLTDYKKHLMK